MAAPHHRATAASPAAIKGHSAGSRTATAARYKQPLKLTTLVSVWVPPASEAARRCRRDATHDRLLAGSVSSQSCHEPDLRRSMPADDLAGVGSNGGLGSSPRQRRSFGAPGRVRRSSPPRVSTASATTGCKPPAALTLLPGPSALALVAAVAGPHQRAGVPACTSSRCFSASALTWALLRAVRVPMLAPAGAAAARRRGSRRSSRRSAVPASPAGCPSGPATAAARPRSRARCRPRAQGWRPGRLVRRCGGVLVAHCRRCAAPPAWAVSCARAPGSTTPAPVQEAAAARPARRGSSAARPPPAGQCPASSSRRRRRGRPQPSGQAARR